MEDKLEHWEEKSKDFIGGFLGMFGRDGRLSEFFQGQKEKIRRVFSPAGSPNRALLYNDGERVSPDSPSHESSPSPPPAAQMTESAEP